MQKTFFVEIGTEELPAKSLRLLAETFSKNFILELKRMNISYSSVNWFATPRRLALKVFDLCLLKCDFKIKKRGPSVSKSFNSDGTPSEHAIAWANSCGISINQAERLVTDKGEWLFFNDKTKKKSIDEMFIRIITYSISNLPISKLMRWSDKDIQFVRPIHTITILFGDNLIEGKIFGVNSKRIIRGHRFMGKSKLIINTADQYPSILYNYCKVIADYEERKRIIISDIKKTAKTLCGEIDLKADNSLVEEVTSLVEWPVVLSGKFKKDFLKIPLEILTLIIKNSQKYFFIYDKNGHLMPNFIFVVNIESSVPEKIIFENEKVIHSRLEDVKFFFKNDSKYNLEYNLSRLDMIFFQKQLGTLYEKTLRIAELAKWVANIINANINDAHRAGILSKCDLLTNMVFEYEELKGIIGMHYAIRDGEIKDVALALKEQYYPRFFNDELPSTKLSSALAIAEKMDDIIGIFGINKQPKSNKDPFALRRAALGVLRIIIEKGYDLDLVKIIQKSVFLYGGKLINSNVENDVIKFMFDRLFVRYRELGYNINIIQAVLACNLTKPYDFYMRLKTLNRLISSKKIRDIIIVNKRIYNILNKFKNELSDSILISKLKTPEEVKIVIKIIVLQIKLIPILIEKDYEKALIQLSSLCEIVDDFFKNVKIISENKIIRINRLTLLNQLRDLFLKIADFSLLD